MATKKTIAIIGASGEMGSAIAKSLTKSDYRLLLMSRDQNRLSKLLAYINKKNPIAEVVGIDCEKEASWEADIILLAVPYGAEKEIAEKIREVSIQKVVIDISNPLNETYKQLIIPADTSAAERLQTALPNSKVVKAFNTVFATDLNQGITEKRQVKTFISGNDEEAIQEVSEIAIAMGLKPALCKELSSARKSEQMMLQLIELKTEENYNNIIGSNIHRHGIISFKSVIR